MQGIEVNCDECQKKFKIKLQERKYKGGIREAYFRCKHCKHKFLVFFTDKDIRRKQRELRILKGTDKHNDRMRLKCEIGKQMDDLKRIMMER